MLLASDETISSVYPLHASVHIPCNIVVLQPEAQIRFDMLHTL